MSNKTRKRNIGVARKHRIVGKVGVLKKVRLGEVDVPNKRKEGIGRGKKTSHRRKSRRAK